MRNIKAAILGLTALAGLPLLATQPASAQLFGGGGCNCGTILQYHRETQQVIGNKVEETGRKIIQALTGSTENYNLIDALQGSTAETGAHIDRTVEAAQRIADAQELNATKRLRDEFRAKAESGEYDPNPVACLLIDMFSGEGGGGGGQQSGGGSNGSDLVNRVAEWGSGQHPAVQAGGTTLSKYIVDQQLALGTRASDFSILMENPTMDLEGENGAAATHMMQTLFYPAPPRPLTESDLATPAGQAEAAWRGYVDTALSAAQRGVAYSLNMRSPVGPSGPYKTIVEDQIANGAYKTPLGNQISELQQLEIRALARYAPSEQAVLDRQNMNQKALLMELVDQMALQNRMTYMQLNLDSNNSVTLATIASLLAQGKTRNVGQQ